AHKGSLAKRYLLSSLWGGEPRPVFSSVERAGFARTLVAGGVSGKRSRARLGGSVLPTAATDQSVISPPPTSSAASATVEMLPAVRCRRISRHRGAISPPFGARSPCSEDPSQILPSADSRAHVSEIRPLGSSSPPKPLGQSRRLRSRLNHVVFRTPALSTGVDHLEPISAERR